MQTQPTPRMYCLQCGYPLLREGSPFCPECGRPFDPGDPRTYSFFRDSRIPAADFFAPPKGLGHELHAMRYGLLASLCAWVQIAATYALFGGVLTAGGALSAGLLGGLTVALALRGLRSQETGSRIFAVLALVIVGGEAIIVGLWALQRLLP